jgi:hypothetical protein
MALTLVAAGLSFFIPDAKSRIAPVLLFICKIHPTLPFISIAQAFRHLITVNFIDLYTLTYAFGEGRELYPLRK